MRNLPNYTVAEKYALFMRIQVLMKELDVLQEVYKKASNSYIEALNFYIETQTLMSLDRKDRQKEHYLVISQRLTSCITQINTHMEMYKQI